MMLEDIATVSCFIIVLRLMTDGSFTNADQMNFLRELEAAAADDATESLDRNFNAKTMFGNAEKPTLKLSLDPSTLVLEKGKRGEVTVTCTLTGLTDRDISWRATAPTVVGVTKADSMDTWTIEGLSEGLVQMTVISNADPNVVTRLSVRVLPSE